MTFDEVYNQLLYPDDEDDDEVAREETSVRELKMGEGMFRGMVISLLRFPHISYLVVHQKALVFLYHAL